MVPINSFNCNFTSNIIQQPIRSTKNSESTNLRSFSNNFKLNTNIKSNVQKKNNIPTVVKKRNV